MSDEKDFNSFVATEEDLKEIVENSVSILPNTPPSNPVKVRPIVAAPVPVENDDEKHRKEIETDYKYVRDNLYTITEKSINALENLSEIAGASQHPRAYEVLGQLVKTIADAQKDLLTLHKEKIKIDTEKTEQTGSSGPEVINNNLFVGSTSQLDELIAQMTKKKDA